MFRIHRCCFLRRGDADQRETPPTSLTQSLASWPSGCTSPCWPLQMSSFEPSAAAAALRWRVRRPNADRHWRFSWRHFNTETLGENWVVAPVTDELNTLFLLRKWVTGMRKVSCVTTSKGEITTWMLDLPLDQFAVFNSNPLTCISDSSPQPTDPDTFVCVLAGYFKVKSDVGFQFYIF